MSTATSPLTRSVPGGAVSPADALGWPTRAALRLYPRDWRADNSAAVVGTLLDVAEATGRRTVPLGELVPLAVRGAWMRARSSVTFWAGLVIIAVMLWSQAQRYEGFDVERAWAPILAGAGGGLRLALPIAAGAAAWAAHRARTSSVGAGPIVRLREVTGHTAAIGAFVAVGYLASIAGILVTSGAPLVLSSGAGIPAAYLATTAGAIVLGYALGAILPVGPAIVLATLGALYWLMSPWWDSADAGWRNLSGYTLADCCTSLYSLPAEGSVAAVTVLGAAAFALGLFVVLAGRRVGGLLATVAALAVVIGSSGFSAPVAAWAGGSFSTDRASTETVCAGEAPHICLWPEQEAEAGPFVRDALTRAYAVAVARGIAVEPTISVVPEALPGAFNGGLWFRGEPTTERLLASYAQAVVAPYSCGTGIVGDDLDGSIAASFAMGTILDPSGDAGALAAGSVTLDFAQADERTYETTGELADYFGIHGPAEAAAFLDGWMIPANACAA